MTNKRYPSPLITTAKIKDSSLGCFVHLKQVSFKGLASHQGFCSTIPVITINDALGEGEVTAKQHDMLIATEAMEVRKELEELLRVHVLDD